MVLSMKRKMFPRMIALLSAVVLLTGLLPGCQSEPKAVVGTGGTPIEAPSDSVLDFTMGYLSQRSALSVEDESWRVGTLTGNGIKVTAGSGAGAWYKETLPEKWLFSTVVSFDGADEAEAWGSIGFGADQNTPVVSLKVERGEKGSLTVSLLKGEETLVTSGPVSGKDTSVRLVLDNNNDDGRLRLYAIGDQKLRYYVLADDIGEEAMASLKTFVFSASCPGVAFADVGVNDAPYRPDVIRAYADDAIQDLMNNFWRGSVEEGNFYKDDPNMIWDKATAMFTIETMYSLTGDEVYKQIIQSQWNYFQQRWTDEQIVKPGGQPNVAHDDDGWTCMMLMTVYRMTGDEHALELAAQTVRNAYKYWADGSLENGMWYRLDDQGDNPTMKPINNSFKSIYCLAQMLTALQYSEITKGTDAYDPDLYADTLTLYNWIYENMCRTGTKTFGDRTLEYDDHLYFMDFCAVNDDDTFPYGPVDYGNLISEAGSCTGLIANTGMCAVNYQLYKMTGEQKYMDRVLATANSIPDSPYNNRGVLLNDRDAWTDSCFMRYWVTEILPLEGVDKRNFDLMKNTALSIRANCRLEEGYYKAEWSGGDTWTQRTSSNEFPTVPQQITTTSTTINMILAAAILEQNGYFS